MRSPDMLADCLATYIPDGDGHQGLQHTTLLLQDTLELSSTFLLQQLFHMVLKAGHKVVLVSAQQSIDKYIYVLKKMGLNLQQSLDSGHVVCIAPLADNSATPSSQQSEASKISPLRQLHDRIHMAIRKHVDASIASSSARDAPCGTSQQTPVTLLVDSMSALRIMATSDLEWMLFVQYVASTGVQLQAPLLKVLRAHADIEDDASWLTWLQHSSQVVLEVSPVEGRVAGVEGSCTITRCTPSDANSVQPWLASSRLFFKGTDAGIRWMSQVTGSDLLWR